MRALKPFVIFFIVTCCAAGADEPFWRAKPKILRRIREERDVVVSVRSESITSGSFAHRLVLAGAGDVSAGLSFSFDQVKRFEKLPEISSMIKKANFEPSTQRLELTVEAFKYRATLPMKVTFADQDQGSRALEFDTLEGAFRGLKGKFLFEKLKEDKTEFSISAEMPYQTLPMPRFFITFGLEVAMQHTAKAMRQFIEANARQLEPKK